MIKVSGFLAAPLGLGPELWPSAFDLHQPWQQTALPLAPKSYPFDWQPLGLIPLRAAHEKVTPQLFCEDQHAAFLELWPGDTRNQDRRTTQWLLEEGLNPEVASQKDSFWAQVARPFVAKVDEGRMLMATAPALAQAGRRENQRL